MDLTPSQGSTDVDEQKLKEQFEGQSGPEGASPGQEDLHLQGHGGYARSGQDVSSTPQHDASRSETEKELEAGGHARDPKVGEETRHSGGDPLPSPEAE